LAATPANVYGDVRLQIFRLASAYILLGMGIVNIIIVRLALYSVSSL
jgi:ubiquinone biosynthesis protein Coq4